MQSPARIGLSRARGLTIEWEDGHSSQYAAGFLREHCPCAACAGRKGSPFVVLAAAPRIVGAEAVGAYALRLHFADGHHSGLYTFERLRALCRCGECVGR